MPSRDDWPWKDLPEYVCKALWAHGVTDVEKLKALKNGEIRFDVAGVGETGLKYIREVIPDPMAGTKPELIPQPGRGGALLAGGVPGNRGGSGTPPSEVRRLSRQGYAGLIPRLVDMGSGRGKIALTQKCPDCGFEGESLTVEDIEAALVTPREQIRAIDVLGKYGIGSAKGVPREELVELVKELGEDVQIVLESRMGTDGAEEACQRIFDRWKGRARERLG